MCLSEVSEAFCFVLSTIDEADQVHVDTATAKAEDTRRRKTWSSRSIPKTAGLAPHSWPHATVHTGLYVYFDLFISWTWQYLWNAICLVYGKMHIIIIITHYLSTSAHLIINNSRPFLFHLALHFYSSQIITFSWSRLWFACKFYGLKLGHI